MAINPNQSNIDTSILSSHKNKSGSNKNLLEDEELQRIEQKLREVRSDDRKKTTETKEVQTSGKAIYQDSIKSSKNLAKESSKQPVNSSAPKLETPKEAKSSEQDILGTLFQGTPSQDKLKHTLSTSSALHESLYQLLDKNQKGSKNIEDTANTLSQKLGTSKDVSSKLMFELLSVFDSKANGLSSAQQKNLFYSLAQKNFPTNTQVMKFLYANPEYVTAMPKEIQENFQSLMQEAGYEESQKAISDESDNFNYNKTSNLEGRYANAVENTPFSQKEKNILKNLFSRPGMAKQYENGEELVKDRHGLLKKAEKEVSQESGELTTSDKEKSGLMRDAVKFSRQFKNNLKSMELDKKTEEEASSLMTHQNKGASPEATKAYHEAFSKTLSDFENYPFGFSRNTLMEAKGFENAIQEGIANMQNTSDATRASLNDLIANPEKIATSALSKEIIDTFNTIVINQGMLGISEAHTKLLTESRAFGDNVKFIQRLKTNLRKKGASKAQVNTFIKKLLDGKVSLNDPIVKAAFQETVYERGLPEDFQVRLPEVKKVFSASQTPRSELASLAEMYLQDFSSAVNETYKELSETPTSSNQKLSLQISSGEFVKLMAKASIEMSSINELITISNSHLQTKIQNAMRSSMTEIQQAQQKSEQDETEMGKLGQYIQDTVITVFMLIVNPIGTITNIHKGGGIGKGGVTSAIDKSLVGKGLEKLFNDVIDPLFTEVIQPILEVVSSFIKDVVKLALIFLVPGLNTLLMPGFMEKVQKEGFKDALNESLITDLNGTLEMFGMAKDSSAMAAIDTVFAALEITALAAVVITATVVAAVFSGGLAAGAAFFMIGGMAVMMTGKILEDLGKEWGDANWLSSSQEQEMMKVVGIGTMAISMSMMIVGAGFSVVSFAQSLPEMLRALKDMTKMVSMAIDSTESLKELPKALIDVGKELMKRGDSIGDKRIRKEAEMLNKDLSSFIDDLNETSDIESSVNKLKNANEKISQLNKINKSSLEELNEALRDAKGALDEISQKAPINKEEIKRLNTNLDSLNKRSLQQVNLYEKSMKKREVKKSAEDEPTGTTDPTTGDGSDPTTGDGSDPTTGDGSDPTTGTDTTTPINAPNQTDAVLSAQTDATSKGVENFLENLKAIREKLLKKIQKIGTRAEKETMEIEDLGDLKTADEKRRKKILENIQKGGRHATRASGLAQGLLNAEQGILNIWKAPFEKDLKDQQAKIEINSDVFDFEQSAFNTLQESSEQATKDIEAAIQFFNQVMMGLTADISGITGALYDQNS